jgi:hypothetical protein
MTAVLDGWTVWTAESVKFLLKVPYRDFLETAVLSVHVSSKGAAAGRRLSQQRPRSPAGTMRGRGLDRRSSLLARSLGGLPTAASVTCGFGGRSLRVPSKSGGDSNG